MASKKTKKPASVAAAIAAPAKRLTRIPPDPEDMNDQRSEAAGRTLDFFSKDFGELVKGEDLTVQNLTDLMCDFGHFCDRNNIRLAAVIDHAKEHYDEETDHKGNQFSSFE